MPYFDEYPQNAPQRDQTILDLRKRGYSYRAIGKAVGMDGSGVRYALLRLQAGGPGTRDPRP